METVPLALGRSLRWPYGRVSRTWALSLDHVCLSGVNGVWNGRVMNDGSERVLMRARGGEMEEIDKQDK